MKNRVYIAIALAVILQSWAAGALDAHAAVFSINNCYKSESRASVPMSGIPCATPYGGNQPEDAADSEGVAIGDSTIWGIASHAPDNPGEEGQSGENLPMATYYVDTGGNDGADGSAGSPWKTINHAVNQNLQPGDEIVVRSGTYTENVYVTQGGAAGNHVTIRSEVEGGAKIRPPDGAYSTVHIQANYVTFDGFDVQGGDGHGIEVHHVHNVHVTNNTSHDSGGSGISAAYGEFFLIEGNTTYNNASTNGWHTSGISVYQARNISGDTTTEGYRIIVRNNVSHNNVEGPTITSQHTDGNGIIIDDFQSTQNSEFSAYLFETLVENNLVYENGSKGIQVVWSDLITVRNNTAYHNNQDLLNPGTWRGEISNSQSSDNIFVNNIAVADPSVHLENTAIDNTSYGGYINTNVIWANNLTFNGTVGDASVETDGGNELPSFLLGNLLGVDPGFVDPPLNFRLIPGSIAIDAGTALYGVADKDLDSTVRVVGAIDIGAYELAGGEPGPVPVPACKDYPLPQPSVTVAARCNPLPQHPNMGTEGNGASDRGSIGDGFLPSLDGVHGGLERWLLADGFVWRQASNDFPNAGSGSADPWVVPRGEGDPDAIPLELASVAQADLAIAVSALPVDGYEEF